jgi:hypothetical protein
LELIKIGIKIAQRHGVVAHKDHRKWLLMGKRGTSVKNFQILIPFLVLFSFIFVKFANDSSLGRSLELAASSKEASFLGLEHDEKLFRG